MEPGPAASTTPTTPIGTALAGTNLHHHLHRIHTAKTHQSSATLHHLNLQTTTAYHSSSAPIQDAEEELDLLYCSDTDEESPCPRCFYDRALKTEEAQDQAESGHQDSRDSEVAWDTVSTPPCRIPSLMVKPTNHQVSYQNTLMKSWTFQPRFSKDSSHRGQQVWFHEEHTRPRLRKASVWSRLGSAHTSIHDAVLPRAPLQAPTHWLYLLKAKAGLRCFKCLAPDHRIGECVTRLGASCACAPDTELAIAVPLCHAHTIHPNPSQPPPSLPSPSRTPTNNTSLLQTLPHG